MHTFSITFFIYCFYKMKLTSIFGQKANLSLIFDPAVQVFVKDVIHKVTIDVSEKGSKASAVTGIL